MAAESVFIYPNGRQLAKQPPTSANPTARLGTGDLKSMGVGHMNGGLQVSALVMLTKTLALVNVN